MDLFFRRDRASGAPPAVDAPRGLTPAVGAVAEFAGAEVDAAAPPGLPKRLSPLAGAEIVGAGVVVVVEAALLPKAPNKPPEGGPLLAGAAELLVAAGVPPNKPPDGAALLAGVDVAGFAPPNNPPEAGAADVGCPAPKRPPPVAGADDAGCDDSVLAVGVRLKVGAGAEEVVAPPRAPKRVGLDAAGC
jgi:hypothetical protein